MTATEIHTRKPEQPKKQNIWAACYD